MPDKYSADLGVDEFAAAIGLFNKPEDAKGLLINAYGQISLDEEKGRLSAAYNSLFARGLLAIESETAKLVPGLFALLEIFFNSQKSIRAGKSVGSREKVVAYYSHANNWLEHSIDQGVAHHLRYPVSSETIESHITTLFSPSASSDSQSISVNMPADLFMNVRPGTLGSYDSVLAILSHNSPAVTEEMKLLADDFAHSLWRGSTTWIMSKEKDEMMSRGYLWLQGNQRLWAITSSTDENSNAWQATLSGQKDFNSKINALIATEIES